MFYAFTVDWCRRSAATENKRANRTSRIQMSNRRIAIVLSVVFLGSPFAFAGPSQSTNSLPSKIITTDGVTYNDPKLSRVEPDGLLVEFQPAAGGIGLANLKFVKLPESLQKQFGYDPRKAADYEQEQKLALMALTQKLQHDEKVQTAALILLDDTPQRPKLAGAVVVNSSDPIVAYTYYTPDQKPALLMGGVANCVHSYQCHADIDVRVGQSVVGQPLYFYIYKVNISLGLCCHITLPESPYDSVKIQQEGHRKVFEYFYRLGPQMANRIGESMIGKEFTSGESGFERAKATALRDAEAQVEIQYVTRLDTVARKANRFYDDLTDRGLNNIDRDQAYQEAVDKFGKDLQN
jgi:hypothetical protein